MNGHGETTIATIAAAQQKHYRRPQAVVGGEEQQQQLQQKQHYYLSNCNNSNNSRSKNVFQSVHHHHQQHNPSLVQPQQHHNHQHRQHQKRQQQQQHQQYQLLHGNQMQYYHQLPIIVNGQQQQQQHQNGSGGDGLVRVGGAGGGFASSSTTSSSPSSSSTAAAAIIVVDPPRPPFIPKKPVLNNGNSAAVDEHPQRHNRIYAQANGDCENGGGGGAVNGGTAMALFDDCSNGTKITQTTITYIGGAAAATAAATAVGLRRTKSPATVMATDIEQYNNGGGAADPKNFWNGSELNGKEQHNNNENNNNNNSSNRSSFGTDSSFSAGSTVVAADQGLHYSVTGMGTIGAGLANNSTLSSNNINGMEKPAATNSSSSSSNSNRVQRRLSLVGGISVKLPDYQRPPISSFGCTTGGQGREGRIYATAGFVANENAKKISTLSSSSVIDRSTAATNGIFGLKSAAATSQMCLNGAGSDGKSTLSRRAQKLAQKAAHKLTIGSLSSELSSSASALYSLFTSSAENGVAANGRSVGTAELGIYAESYLGTSQHFYHDKAPVVSAHTSRGIDFLERFGQFAKERALIEEEYAAKLKSLAKRSRGKKTEDDESKMYTTTMAFLTMLGEIESLASQHEVIGERLRNDLCPQLVEKCRQLRAMRKKQYQDFEMMEKHLQARVDELAKQKKNYEKAHLDAQGAHVKCAKADKNLHLSRIELERAKTNVNTKNAICEQSKQNYAAQLGATNQAKFDHYNVILPQLLEDMRQLDVERIEFSKKAMLDCVASETSVLNIIQRCYSDMNTAIGTINPNRDTLAVVEQTKTGFAHPLDFQFEDLGDPADILLDGTESFDGSTLRRQPGQGKGANGKGGGGVPRKHSLKLFSNSNNGKTNGSAGTNGGGGGGGGGGTCGANTGGEYGTLPPQQRCRKIQQKLEELEAELNIKDQSQAGMQRMHVAYTQNPQLGNPAKVAEQLLQNQQEMHTLQTQIQRFKELLQSAQGELNQPLGGNPHQHQAAQQQMHNAAATTTTSSSSPGSSPRGSIGNVAGKLKNGQQHHHGGRLNGGGPPQMGSAEQQQQQHRASSYSEASSISSADGSMMMLSASFNGGPGASGTAARTTSGTIYPQLPPMSTHPQQHQQMNGGINGTAAGAVLHQSASGTTLSSSGAANCASAVAAPNISSSSFCSATAAAAGSAPAPPCQQHVPYVDTGSGDFYEECDTSAAAAANGCPVPQQQSDIVLGTAIAMYAYDAAPDEVGGTTISMRDGDELLLLERDVGDGWTRVRHMQSNAEGFVPSSYLECKWYSTDA